MSHINKILIALDLSVFSFQILEHAFELAGKLDCSVLIVNVINKREIDAMKNAIAKIKTEFTEFKITTTQYVQGVMANNRLFSHGIIRIIMFSPNLSAQ